MNGYRLGLSGTKIGKIAAAILVGLSIGVLIRPDPISLPVVGTAPALAVGGLGLLLGGTLYRWVPALLGSTDCGCSGDCGCS